MILQALTVTDVIAGYAALVASAAFALEVRRWFDARPKVAITVEAPWTLSALPEQKYIRATVYNRWDRPFTIEYFAVMEFRTVWHRLLLNRNCWNGLIWRPNPEKPLPYRIEPGETWDGIGEFTDEIGAKLRNNKLFVAVRCSFRDKPIIRRVRSLFGTERL